MSRYLNRSVALQPCPVPGNNHERLKAVWIESVAAAYLSPKLRLDSRETKHSAPVVTNDELHGGRAEVADAIKQNQVVVNWAHAAVSLA
jgi:hypothetical protein